jgi:hypothetical protein
MLASISRGRAEANNGELREPIKEALVTYADAFGYKADRISSLLQFGASLA